MAAKRTRIWDLPTRAFHWAFAFLVLLSWISGQFGGSDWREWHFRSGYALLALLAFRLLWGFAGDRYARFSSFRPALKALSEGRFRLQLAGHSTTGSVSVSAMLAAAAIQVLSGLMATDGNYTEGPWAKLVSDRVMNFMTSVHAVNRWVLLVLVSLHLGAVAWYVLGRRESLIRPMFTGDKFDIDAPAADDDSLIRWRGAILLALAAALAAFLTTV